MRKNQVYQFIHNKFIFLKIFKNLQKSSKKIQKKIQKKFKKKNSKKIQKKYKKIQKYNQNLINAIKKGFRRWLKNRTMLLGISAVF